ncbi:hypothetical protein L210DRAFT_3504575 [Boletus edulis BED1]|uniref:Uncharacterized protein n=1 Tax=Boletus edulis BED1 TaxID=1328754 RepID=A0AAD4GER6_BOLED|nr:hypothetical protein L210DRAFT_3504575 [Boletus edulis BED1]
MCNGNNPLPPPCSSGCQESRLFDVLTNNGRYEALFPDHYLEHVRRYCWREDCIRMVLEFGDKLQIPHTLQYNLEMVLWYMDEVFNRLEAETKRDVEKDPICRSKTFDSYLKIEYWVSHHEPTHVRDYRRSHNRNINCSYVGECESLEDDVDEDMEPPNSEEVGGATDEGSTVKGRKGGRQTGRATKGGKKKTTMEVEDKDKDDEDKESDDDVVIVKGKGKGKRKHRAQLLPIHVSWVPSHRADTERYCSVSFIASWVMYQ